MIRIDLALGLGDELTLLQLDETSEPPRVDGGIYFYSAPMSGEPLGRWAQYFADSTETVSDSIKYPKDLAGVDITTEGRWHFFQAGAGEAAITAIVNPLVAQAVTDANEYTDDQVIILNNAINSAIGLLQSEDTGVLSSANSYTDSQITTLNSTFTASLAANATASNAYADTAEQDAKNFATAADTAILATATSQDTAILATATAQDATNLALTDRIIVNAFRITTAQTLTDGSYNTLIWNSAPVNIGGLYNATTGIFTPNQTRFYEFEWGASFETDGVSPINIVGTLFAGANAAYQCYQLGNSPGLSQLRAQPLSFKWFCTSGVQYSLRMLTQVASENYVRLPFANPQHFTQLVITECRS